MPIITPAYPSQNSTFNVTPSTRDVMKREFEQSLAVCEEVWAGRAGWEKLFETPNFFAKYKHFIVLQASSASEEDQLEWYGLVESKVRHLVGYLEKEAIDLVHVWPKTYPSLEAGREKTCCYWFLGLVIRQQQQQQASAGGEAPVQQPQSLDLTTPIKKFTELVMGTAITIKRWKEGMKVEADYRKRKQLAQYLPPSERHKLRTERRSTPAAAANVAATAASAASATTAGNSQQQTGGAADASEAAPAAAPTAAAAGATDAAAAGENSAPPSATAPASNTTATAPSTPTSAPSAAGKRRPSDNDDASNGGGGGSGGGQVDGSGEAAGEQPPPMKRSNTADSEMSNGVQVS